MGSDCDGPKCGEYREVICERYREMICVGLYVVGIRGECRGVAGEDRAHCHGVVGEWVCGRLYRGEGEGGYLWGMSWGGG